MTAMAQNSELVLFITHVEADGPLLKIWGQVDRHAATRVERMILPLSEKFAQGLGLPNPNFPLPANTICCACFQNEGYYRAKICSVQPNGNVLVNFIDYGNFEILPPTAIRLLDNIPGAVSLQAFLPLALDFVLANIVPLNGVWEIETIESIKQSLRYADLKGFLHSTVGSHRLLKLCYNNEDFGDLLVSKNLAMNVSVQDMFSRRQEPHQNRPLQQFSRENISPYVPRVQYNQNPGPQEDWRNPQHRQPAIPHVPEALVFKSRVLDVGSVHDVFVSYVEDGPLKFAVQVQSTSQILKQLMNEINNYPTAPLQEPPLPGSVCLGRYSQDKVLCRAVVMAVMEHKCKLYYVDFGHTEVLPYSDIFQLPPQYINPRVLSIRFTLSGLKDMTITEATKEYFKKIVTGKPLVLQVRPPEGPPLIQYGDLYENGINIRDLLKESCGSPNSIALYQEPLRLQRGMKEIVHVSFVESCNKFFIQLDSGVKSLNSIMACLAEYAKSAPQLEEKCLQVGWPCCAAYGEDKQWYRAQILRVKGDQVTVLYVDYGNEETVASSTLRKMHNNLVTNLRSQAIRCVLNGFQTAGFNQENVNQFELLVLEKKLAMEVLDQLPSTSVVDLYDCSVTPMVNIASKLQFSNTVMKVTNLNSSISSQEGEQGSNSSRSPDPRCHSEERNNKWGKNSKPNNWGSEMRSTEWNPRGRSNNHEIKGEFEEKSRAKNVKDVENEHKQRENNRHNGEDRLHPKETRNNHFNRNEPASRNRFERNEDTGPKRGHRGNRFGSSSRISREDNRFDKSISKDDSWSDRDSDTSSRSSGKRGSKGPRGIKGRTDRGGRHGGDRKATSGKWSDGDSDRSSQRSTQSTGFRSKDRNSANSSWKNAKTQPNKTGSWNSMSPTSPVKEPPRVQKLRIPPPNITVGAIKNVEITYTASPTDFYVQLCPDNVELDALMEKIGQRYNSGGTIIKKSDIHPGISCIAQYSFDSKWYRAIVKTHNADSVSVHFIDYGNTEVITHDKIKELQAEFAKLSAQAVHCKLFAATKSSWSDGEIDEFARSTEETPLEAEFLAQDNGLYEVLLKPIEENNLEPNYVNKNFCGDTDLIQAKKDLKIKAKGNSKKSREIIPQYISAAQKWSDEIFENGYQIDVVVTWFVNPNNFYCQILSKQSEFRTMMNNIQEAYVEQQPIRITPQVRAPVIAFFSDDGALYRAEIKELNKLRGHIVQYIDFGNCAMVDPCKIYPVEKRFAVLPKQAMHCSLKNVSPATGIDWSKANKHEIDKYFDADKYQCTFHGTKDGKYLISLSNNGKDIGDSMIDAGLAVNPEICCKAIVDKVTTLEQSLDSKDIDTQDLALWSGQIIRTHVCDVHGAAKFFIQLPTLATSQKVVEDLKNSTSTDQAATQYRLVECYLFNVIPTLQVDDTLRKLIAEKDAIVSIKNVNNQRFAVELYDASGKMLKLVESNTDDSVSPICPMPVLSLTERVWVKQIDNSENIWIQRSSELENIAELLRSLDEYYSASGTPLVPEVGKLCVAESSDKNWYRGMIENVKETEALVRFIDYGHSEKVPVAVIKALEPQFYVPHQMTLKVSLIVRLKGTDKEQQTILHQNLDDKEFTATLYNVSNKWLVELVENGKKISDTLSELDVVAEFKETTPQLQQIPEMIVGNRYEVFLSHSNSPAQFWLQRSEECKAIEAMQADLQIAALKFSSIEGIPEEGTLCAALYSVDSMWYRAEVLDADEDITTVRFIDYGNTDVVDSNSNNIKELPQSWKSVKKYGLKSRLDLIPIGSEDWSTASCEMFEKMATATNAPITALIIADSVPRRVELFVEENSIGDALVREGHAIMVHNAEDLIDEIIDLELDPRSAFVSHVNSPSEFWVQEEKSVSDLEIMTDRFIVAEMFPKLDEIVEGTLCVAKFPDDAQWYRARVNSHSPLGTQVLFIDYGNSSISTELRTIPEDLASIVPLSRKCSLQLPPGVKEWSAKACDKFVDLAADGATIFLLDVIEEGETSVVSLTLDGVNVTDQLTKLCDTLSVIDERLPPLGEENSPNIVVSHVNSPSEFWTQLESSMSELEIMASRLVDAQSLLPLNTFNKETICAAKFPEDEGWYRARILSHGESGTNVLYFDYGNSALTTELRILPEDVANIPSLAMRCTLKLPEDVESWSEEASAKFNELVADGATMFQFELLDDNDPTLIALQHEGRDVADILKPLCKHKVLTEENNEQIIKPLPTAIVDSSMKDQQEAKIDEIVEDATKDSVKSDINGVENAESNSSDNICKVEQIQTDNFNVLEEEKTQINDSSRITHAETVKSDLTAAGTGEISALGNVCKTERALTDSSDISYVEKIPNTKDISSDELAPRKEITPKISEPVLSVIKTELPDPVKELNLENLIDKASEKEDSKVPVTFNPESISLEMKKEPDTLKELTVDDIVGNMVKVALVEGSEETELKDEIPGKETLDELIVNETKKPVEVSEDVVKDCGVSTPQKTPKIDKIVPGSISRGSLEEDIPLSIHGRRRSSCSEERIVPGGINKGNDLTEVEIVDLLSEQNQDMKCTPQQRIGTKEEEAVTFTPGKTQREEKIVPGSISRGESPTVELSQPTTPKTPHSEKLLAGVVNLHENLSEFEEQDEILTVEVENNIPEQRS